MLVERRNILAGLGALMAAAPLQGAAAPQQRSSMGITHKPARLHTGDIIGLIEPASASDTAFDLTIVEENIRALGLIPKRASHLAGRYGYYQAQTKIVRRM